METSKEKIETAATKIATGKEKMETGRAKAASAGAKTESVGAAPTLRRCPTPRKPQNAQFHTAQPYRNLPEKPLDIGGGGALGYSCVMSPCWGFVQHRAGDTVRIIRAMVRRPPGL